MFTSKDDLVTVLTVLRSRSPVLEQAHIHHWCPKDNADMVWAGLMGATLRSWLESSKSGCGGQSEISRLPPSL